MHVLILNQTFHPDIAATGQLMWDLARHLRAAGHRVTALTGGSYYGTDRRHALARESIEGIDIHRVGGTALGKISHLARLADFASFYALAAIDLQKISSPDVILALTSPPLVATLAMLQKQFTGGVHRRTRFVYHIMDLYPDAAMAMDVIDPGTLLGRTLRRITARTLDTADAVIALGRDMKERLMAVYHGHGRADRIHVVPPWADGQSLYPVDKSLSRIAKEHGLLNTFNVVYSGNLGMAHDLETMISAIDATRRDNVLRWVFVGGGKRSDQLRQEAANRRWGHIVFLPFQDRNGLNDSLNLADVHLVSQLPAFTGVVVPSKLFGIMAVGKPSIMIGPADAECSRIICENSSGFVIPNGNPGLLISRIEQFRSSPALCRDTGARARRAFETQYTGPIACAKIEAILRGVIERN